MKSYTIYLFPGVINDDNDSSDAEGGDGDDGDDGNNNDDPERSPLPVGFYIWV